MSPPSEGARVSTVPVEVVAFDVNETMFSLAAMGPAFEAEGLDPALVPLWFARVLRDGFALTVVGDFAPFRDLGASALRLLAPERAEADGFDDAVDRVLDAFGTLEAHPDVEPALRLLVDAGVRVVTLTNGSAALTEALLDRAGLRSLVERCLSVEEVRRWKPAPEPYLWAAQVCGVEPGRMALVAAHALDCDGARRAGLLTGWVSRLERLPPAVFAPADSQGQNLVDVVHGLLAAG